MVADHPAAVFAPGLAAVLAAVLDVVLAAVLAVVAVVVSVSLFLYVYQDSRMVSCIGPCLSPSFVKNSNSI